MAEPGLAAGRLSVAQDYRLPRESPASRANWEIDASRTALLIHDMQNYFLSIYPDGSSVVGEVTDRILALRDRCDEVGVPVFYTAQIPHRDPRDRGLQADIWGPGMGGDGEDSEIVGALAPGSGHKVLRKWRYSAFQRSTLQPMLAARGRDQLIITGVYAQIGCLLTAADAFMRDIQPFLPVDAVADFSLRRHLAAVDYVGQHCGRTLTSAQLLERL